MKKIYYEKIGRRYVPVAEYDSDYLDSFPRGDHLVSVYPGGSSRRFNINPAYAPLIAASRVAEDAMLTALREASKPQPNRSTPLTEEQRLAWNNLVETFGDDWATIKISSASDIVQAGIEVLQREADVLLSYSAVRKAYDHFMLMVELTKEHNNVDD